MAGILGADPSLGILGGWPQPGILGGKPSFATMYPTVGMNTPPLPSASAPWYGEQPGILAKMLMGARDVAMQANQAMPWGGNDPSAIGIDTQAGTIDPSVMVPFASNVAGMATTGSMAAPPVAGGMGMGIRAYHGSPHDFDRFSMDKIGTGEGAQAFGHGLYFAESPAVAKQYRDAIGGGDVMIGGKPMVYGEDLPWNIASMLKNIYKGDIDKMIADYPKLAPDLQEAKARGVEWKPSGKTYEVDIDASPDEFLDWDKPLSEQSPKVREVLEGMGINTKPQRVWTVKQTPKGWTVYDQWGQSAGTFKSEDAARAKAASGTSSADSMGGMYAYTQMGGNTAYSHLDKGGASEALRAAGIKGIRYKDAGSRGGTEGGTSNYVVFSDDVISILKKYGLAGLTAAGGAGAALLGNTESSTAAAPGYQTGGRF